MRPRVLKCDSCLNKWPPKSFLLSIACCLNAAQGESSLHWSGPVSSVSVVTLSVCWLTVVFLLKSMTSLIWGNQAWGGLLQTEQISLINMKCSCLNIWRTLEVVCILLLQPRGNPIYLTKDQRDPFRRGKCNNGCSLYCTFLHENKTVLVKQSFEKHFKKTHNFAF